LAYSVTKNKTTKNKISVSVYILVKKLEFYKEGITKTYVGVINYFAQFHAGDTSGDI
jgi:hypothetical protein